MLSTNGRRTLCQLGAAFALLSLAGCGPNYQFAEVSGKVTLNREPMPGVIVYFYPETDTVNRLPFATAITDRTGTYRLTTEYRDETKPGAVVGVHRVVVTWPSRDRMGERDARGVRAPLPTLPVPLEYTVASKTPLKGVVKAGGPQSIDLQLEGPANASKAQ